MNRKSKHLLALVAIVFPLLLVVLILLTVPNNPVAYIRVVDEAGAPVAGATIKSEGTRTKSGPYVFGWYGWRSETNGGVANPPVTTDKNGYAKVPYPKYVFEHIETGTLCLSVNHPSFVADRPERVVDTTPPAGAPWQVRLDFLKQRIMRKELIAHIDPVVLKKGATLVLHVANEGMGGQLSAQVSGEATFGADYWIQPRSGLLMTHRVAAGAHSVRAIQVDRNGIVWFSDAVPFNAIANKTNELFLALKRGATLRGELDVKVPRPVKNGRVVAHVWPFGSVPKDWPPQWHGWAKVNENGIFAIPSLPEGDLEVDALCDGWISTNGPGQYQMRYPQKHAMSTNDLEITLGMERTARLEVQVMDGRGNPLKDVQVATSPNVRYGEWSAVLLMADCYNSADWMLGKADRQSMWDKKNTDYMGVTDATGLAVLPNVPATEKTLEAGSDQFALPVINLPGGFGKLRQTNITLKPGQTNHMTIHLEPIGKDPISHY